MIPEVRMDNIRIIYPDYLGTSPYNKYHRSLFNVIVTPEEAEGMAASGIKVKMTKPTQNYPVPEPYVEINIAFSFLNKDGGEEPARNPPIIKLNNLSQGTEVLVDASNLEILARSKLSNVNIVFSQSTPKINPVGGALKSAFYLRSMTADVVEFYMQR